MYLPCFGVFEFVEKGEKGSNVNSVWYVFVFYTTDTDHVFCSQGNVVRVRAVFRLSSSELRCIRAKGGKLSFGISGNPNVLQADVSSEAHYLQNLIRTRNLS